MDLVSFLNTIKSKTQNINLQSQGSAEFKSGRYYIDSKVNDFLDLYCINLMTINQLFKNKPPMEIVTELLNIYGLSNLNDSKIFSKIDLIQNNTLNKINSFKLKIINYYLPCKSKIYLNNIDHKKLITILK